MWAGGGHRVVQSGSDEPSGPVVQHLVLEPPERFHLDLTDPLSRQADFPADLLQREGSVAFESEAKSDHASVAFIDRF